VAAEDDGGVSEVEEPDRRAGVAPRVPPVRVCAVLERPLPEDAEDGGAGRELARPSESLRGGVDVGGETLSLDAVTRVGAAGRARARHAAGDAPRSAVDGGSGLVGLLDAAPGAGSAWPARGLAAHVASGGSACVLLAGPSAGCKDELLLGRPGADAPGSEGLAAALVADVVRCIRGGASVRVSACIVTPAGFVDALAPPTDGDRRDGGGSPRSVGSGRDDDGGDMAAALAARARANRAIERAAAAAVGASTARSRAHSDDDDDDEDDDGHGGAPTPGSGLATLVGGSPRRALRSAAAVAAAGAAVATPPSRDGSRSRHAEAAGRAAALEAAAEASRSRYTFSGSPAVSLSRLHGRPQPDAAVAVRVCDAAPLGEIIATVRHALRQEAVAAHAVPGSAAATAAGPGVARHAHRLLIVDVCPEGSDAWGRVVLVSLGDTGRSHDVSALLRATPGGHDDKDDEGDGDDDEAADARRRATEDVLKHAHAWATGETTALGRALSGKQPHYAGDGPALGKDAPASALAAAASSPLLRLLAPCLDSRTGCAAFFAVVPDAATAGRRLRLLRSGASLRGAARCPDDGASASEITEALRFAARLRRNAAKLHATAAAAGLSQSGRRDGGRVDGITPRRGTQGTRREAAPRPDRSGGSASASVVSSRSGKGEAAGGGVASRAVRAAGGSGSRGSEAAAAVDDVVEAMARGEAGGVVAARASPWARAPQHASLTGTGSWSARATAPISGSLSPRGSFRSEHTPLSSRPPRQSMSSAEMQRHLRSLPRTAQGVSTLPDDTGSGTSQGEELAGSEEDSDAGPEVL